MVRNLGRVASIPQIRFEPRAPSPSRGLPSPPRLVSRRKRLGLSSAQIEPRAKSFRISAFPRLHLSRAAFSVFRGFLRGAQAPRTIAKKLRFFFSEASRAPPPKTSALRFSRSPRRHSRCRKRVFSRARIPVFQPRSRRAPSTKSFWLPCLPRRESRMRPHHLRLEK